MKKSHQYKLFSLLCLCTVLLAYNQCVTPMGNTTKKSAMKFSKSGLSPNGTSDSSFPGINSSDVKRLSLDAFKTTVYPLTRTHCISCHESIQTPLHASSSLETAHSALVDNFKIDFNNIPNSRLVLKLKNERHNCWADCSANAAEMQRKIIEWKGLVDESIPEGSDKTMADSEKMTRETPLISDIFNPENFVDQGTITLMPESGSLKTPIVKGSDNGISYVHAPEGSGTKSLASSNAGIITINFQMPQSDFYKIFMLVNAPDANSDSAFIKVAGSGMFEWHMKLTKGFEWREVTSTPSFQETPFYISGETPFSLEIRQRDDGLKISKIVITNDPAYNPDKTKKLKFTISMPIAELSGVSDAVFEIDIEDYDMYSYKLTNPRIKTSKVLYVKNLKVLVNGAFNPQHSTYTVVNKKISVIDETLSNYSMILLKDKGPTNDKLSFSFGHLADTPVEEVTTPKTAPPSAPSTTPATKLSSVARFQQSLWPMLRNRCMGCHASNQQPLHAHADVTTAHNFVVEGAFVNFSNISGSKISNKLRNNNHNCWSDCASNANEIENQITIWKNLSGK